MSVMDDLADEVRSLLSSHGVYRSRTAWLKGNVSANALTLPLDSSTPVGESVIEVGDEAIYVRSWDQATGTATVAPDGRGWDGTPPMAHSVGERAVIDPTHPRTAIKRAIRQTVERLWPDVFAVGEYAFFADAARCEYVLPGEVEAVLSVDAEDWRGEWCPVRSYRFTQDGPDGPTLDVFSGLLPGGQVRVVYSKRANVNDLEYGTWAQLGLPEGARAAVVYGAAAHLMRFSETGRVTSPAGSSDQFEGVRPFYVTATKIAGDLDQQYQRAVIEERRRLRQKYPPRIVRTR